MTKRNVLMTARSSGEEPDQGTFVSLSDHPCCFCRGRFHMVKRVLDDEVGVLHVEPACERFLDMDLLDYTVANRRALGIPDPQVE